MILTRSHYSCRVHGVGTEIIRSPELGLEPFIDLHDQSHIVVLRVLCRELLYCLPNGRSYVQFGHEGRA